MSKYDIKILFDGPDRTCSGGDVVSGEVLVEVRSDVRCRGIVLTHYWATHGTMADFGGMRSDSGPRKNIQLYESRALQAGERLCLPFKFYTEPWPLTYHGDIINLDHYVHVRVAVDMPWWAFGRKNNLPKQEERFIVLPGQTPAQFTGDLRTVNERFRNYQPDLGQDNYTSLKDMFSKFNSSLKSIFSVGLKKFVDLGCLGKSCLGSIVLCVLCVALGQIVGLLLLLWLTIGLLIICCWLYKWLHKKAVSNLLKDVTILAPVVVVAPEGTWACHLSFTPRKTFEINELSVTLKGKEIAVPVKVRGDNDNRRLPSKSLFEHKEIILDGGMLVAGELFSKTLKIALPQTDAWSLDLASNGVLWTVDVRIDIPKWPDWSHRSHLLMVPRQFL